jgi:LuxR family maltose regulon positive regulatory protein
MVSLLQTKLKSPTVPPRYVKRPFLTKRLQDGLESGRSLTLISAPAGFGKTTCISEWLQIVRLPVAWLSLDAADNEPGRFFSYLLAALQTVDANLGQEIEGILRAGQLPPAEIISTTLINDSMGVASPFLLILDDFQVIQDEFILQVLQTLVLNFPLPLHLVLLTREEPSLPLARLRANNQLTEIRAADLRFSDEETAAFLQEVMGLSLTKSDIAALEEKTEGWIAGLQLAGLSVRDRANPSTYIADLSGSHRHILSYLTEEVLNQQSAAIQDFLLHTSILDRLTGELCDAVTGGENGRSLLEQLYQDNLFLLPLDDEGQWYRYHHLFADLLRDRQQVLSKEETADLHRRASQWYAQAGMSSEAIQHAIDAEDYETAVSLIEEHAMDMLMAWHAKTVTAWMEAIPPEWAAKSPKTNLAFAWMNLFQGKYTEAMAYIGRLQAMFAGDELDENDPVVQAEWLALQSTLLNGQDQAEAALALANQALAIVPEDAAYVRSLIYSGQATAYKQMDDFPQAVAAYQELIQYGRAANSLISELMGRSALALYVMERGQLHYAFEIAREGVALVERSGTLPPISSAVYGELGSIYYQWHELEKAHANFERSTQVSILSGYSDAALYHHVVKSRLAQIEGDLETAVHEIQSAVDLMHLNAPAAVRQEVVSQEVRVMLAQGQLDKAGARLKPFGFSFKDPVIVPERVPGQAYNNSVEHLYNNALRVLLLRGDVNSWQQGVELATRLIDDAQEHGYVQHVIERLLIRAQMYAALGDESASYADVREALALAEPENCITLFVEAGGPIADSLKVLLRKGIGVISPDFVQKILAAFPQASTSNPRDVSLTLPASDSVLVEPLSKRELEILQLIGAGYSNQEIAEKLVVTLHTVKKHSSNIYGKLGVSSRTQAVARARLLNLF